MTTDLAAFMEESNRIEGILRRPSEQEIDATRQFLAAPAIFVEDVVRLVGAYQPDAILRDKAHLNVRVGNHIAPCGGPEIVRELSALLERVSACSIDVWLAHLSYETMHPFTDGNGRSGRAIWLWQMERIAGGTQIGFLHAWYYQTLSRAQVEPRDD